MMQRTTDVARRLRFNSRGTTTFLLASVKRARCIPLAAAGAPLRPEGAPQKNLLLSGPPRFLYALVRPLQQRRCMQTHPHVHESVPLPHPANQGVGPLQGAPHFTPMVKDLKKNFLEVDPDNPTRLLEYFSDLLRHGNLEPSDAQKDLMREMQALLDAIEAEQISRPDDFNLDSPGTLADTQEAPTASKPQMLAALASLWNRFIAVPPRSEGPEAPPDASKAAPIPKIRGLYIWGGVGQGKTMILDAFYDCLNSKKKMRVHFHQFMLDVQQELHHLKKEQPTVSDPLMEVARKIRHNAKVLCFDEFQVVHITDAMIMKRLFEGLFSVRVFQLKSKLLAKGGVSCRSLFYAPPRPDEVIMKQLEKAAGGPLEPGEIQVAMGRTLKVPLMRGGFAAFSFGDLCATNVGAADYLSLAARFHTLSLHSIPDLHQMDLYPNEIRRFISLIDVLYERQMEELRASLRAKFRRLGEAFDAMELVRVHAYAHGDAYNVHMFAKRCMAFRDHCLPYLQHCREAGIFTAEEWMAAATKVLGLSHSTAQCLFTIMSSDGSVPLSATRIRSLLFFHMACFDFAPPTTADLFLFSNEGEATEIMRHPAVYELNK
ncbi:afg1 family protein [Cyclospora cayetanensis]|uniref:Afg1 family protein n=1 Tax=Cyclospora cayetanensis TaxID=88456 RepID=A0A1D3CS70_9EIME|nr:afg1 family protein [Cyclospora cayetanensis]